MVFLLIFVHQSDSELLRYISVSIGSDACRLHRSSDRLLLALSSTNLLHKTLAYIR